MDDAQELKDRVSQMRRSSEVKACLKNFYDGRVSELMK
jgi:hypothetical protein